MRKLTFPPVVFLVAVMAIGAAAQIAPAGAPNKCDALKKAMDEAEAKSLAADSVLFKAMEVLAGRLEEHRAADAVYAEALRTETKAKEAWIAAIAAVNECRDKFPEAQCKTEIQAVKNCYDKMDLASRQSQKWPRRIATAKKNVDDALKAYDAASKSAKAVREAHDQAEAAYNQCLGGKVTP
jgi:hypothetical protein